MKKLLLCIVLIITTTNIYAQGTWNKDQSLYVNNTLGISWKIPYDLTWEQRPIVGDHCLLKIRNNEIGFALTLEAQSIPTEYNDIWKIWNLYEDPQNAVICKRNAASMGMTYQSSESHKGTLCSQHAAISTADFTQYWPSYQVTTHYATYMCELFYKGEKYTLTILGMSVPYDGMGKFYQMAKEILNGFSLIKKDLLP